MWRFEMENARSFELHMGMQAVLRHHVQQVIDHEPERYDDAELT